MIHATRTIARSTAAAISRLLDALRRGGLVVSSGSSTEFFMRAIHLIRASEGRFESCATVQNADPCPVRQACSGVLQSSTVVAHIGSPLTSDPYCLFMAGPLPQGPGCTCGLFCGRRDPNQLPRVCPVTNGAPSPYVCAQSGACAIGDSPMSDAPFFGLEGSDIVTACIGGVVNLSIGCPASPTFPNLSAPARRSAVHLAQWLPG